MKTKITAEEECNVPAAAQLSLAGQKLNFADTAHFNIYITLSQNSLWVGFMITWLQCWHDDMRHNNHLNHCFLDLPHTSGWESLSQIGNSRTWFDTFPDRCRGFLWSFSFSWRNSRHSRWLGPHFGLGLSSLDFQKNKPSFLLLCHLFPPLWTFLWEEVIIWKEDWCLNAQRTKPFFVSIPPYFKLCNKCKEVISVPSCSSGNISWCSSLHIFMKILRAVIVAPVAPLPPAPDILLRK